MNWIADVGGLAVVDRDGNRQRLGRGACGEHLARRVVLADHEVGGREPGHGLAAAIEDADVDLAGATFARPLRCLRIGEQNRDREDRRERERCEKVRHTAV